jgi:hypothetical protein
MAPLATIYTPVWTFFSGLVPAASGTIIQATYTVPTGLRAELVNCFILGFVNAGGANTETVFIDVIPITPIFSFRIISMNVSGLAAATPLSYACNIPLIAGEQVRAVSTFIAGSVNTTVSMHFTIKLYN